ncbi:MAG: glycosyltransferase [Prolixibacteraceae bacterium]|jgi:cellulose synthase/poly-beta-1,6-N-acetylglucosamine synthase-like glycosyltransferase|nr:glycosyltransferase [Prolixibacteraceae bacterium]
MIILQLIFWISVWALVHSYIGYPLFLQLIITIKGKKKYKEFTRNNELPKLSILMAAYNEEAIIEKKIRSIFNTTYPLDKIEILVGSDNSTDSTNSILKHLAIEFPQIHFKPFSSRQGKVNIINQLSDLAISSILIITDANVLLEPTTLFELVKYFADNEVGLVDTHMKNYGFKKDGISIQEKSYISREVFVKQLESNAFGTMIGPFGGCYAIRKELFTKVPSNFTVDDFFICMNVLVLKKKTINNLNSIVFEDVSNNLNIEFKRKIRIAIGNFQNLHYYRKLLANPFTEIGFSFISHKVLRWFGPFFLVGALLANILLIKYSNVYFILLMAQLFVTFLPIADIFLKKFGLHIVLLRFATHFYTMNLSLLIGFIKSIKGIESNVWRPTKRFQE